MPSYGYEHKKLRAQWKVQVDAGGVLCARCGNLIEPGTPWDLGHVDGSDDYQGPEHRSCNRATLSHVKQANASGYDWFV